LDKFKQTKSLYSQNQLSDIQKLINEFQQTTVKNPSFICFQNDRLIPIACGNVAYFYIQNLIVYAVVENTHYVLEETMDEIEKRLPQQLFFRANRQFIIQKRYILNAEIYFNNRLLVKLSIKTPEDIIISREKTTSFKSWLIGA
jgi:two-component system, LytTR family, response regulator LytT